MTAKKEKCQYCGLEFTIGHSFTKHLKKEHNCSYKQYIIETKYKGIVPVCVCGCGEETRFARGIFAKYKRNHTWNDENINYRDKIKNSLKKTIKEKYGVDNVMFLQEVKDKIKKTCLEKYGVEWGILSREAKKKTKETIFKRYGVEYLSQNQDIKKRIFDKQKHSYEEIVNICKEKGYIPLFNVDEYTGHRQYLKFFCKQHEEIFETQLFFIKTENNQCPKCKIHGFSLKEKNILQFVKNMYNGIILENSRYVVTPFELDIFIPDKNIAIEFNGEYWHSLEKTIENDAKKRKMCEEKGIQLFIVWEEDWDKNPESIKEKIKELING